MIALNLKAILLDREIKDHSSFLHANGFTWPTISRMLNNKCKGISFKHMEMLCTLLHCTPNDLILWTGDNGAQPQKLQPLHHLAPPRHRGIISEGFKSLPLSDLREIRKKIEEEVQSKF